MAGLPSVLSPASIRTLIAAVLVLALGGCVAQLAPSYDKDLFSGTIPGKRTGHDASSLP